MTKIGIISDTHGGICPDVFNYFKGVDAILHAGDIGNEDVLIELEALAPVYAVRGNIDFFEAGKTLPVKRIESFEGVRFGIVHGDNFTRSALPDQLISYFADDHINAIVFGHTHEKYLQKAANIWLINPGAADPRIKKSCNSVIVVEVNSGKIQKIRDVRSGRVYGNENLEKLEEI
ncbi:hypothetical protein BMS3Abin05_01895 [bacterium BMS3Abin05]|nr:hypothetical protein BMS3Abin05_01895 [bacterium BMS3Abin05]GBE27466.1 hypothetical protein BMS3Bbin03_01391 [bacterium BMS3Bbin03]HDK36253.1 metallophosphoesterase [Bacteroidota bacterium]HDL78969.1 metallophosphoesterase [Bacteroidota bacterium]HDZ12774.1 metallophosphoesterase [Bacteroidota bacterium]